MIRFLLILALFFIPLTACQNKKQENKTGNANKDEALIRINKYLVKKDSDAIKGYISRHGWNMTETKAGLWYEITHKGNGPKAETGKTATLSYKISLIDGTVCYTSDESGDKTFVIGKGGVEPGLEQGILLLNEGDKARFIMPPHLAYGLIGDENKIPARATIVYEIHLLKIADQ